MISNESYLELQIKLILENRSIETRTKANIQTIQWRISRVVGSSGHLQAACCQQSQAVVEKVRMEAKIGRHTPSHAGFLDGIPTERNSQPRIKVISHGKEHIRRGHKTESLAFFAKDAYLTADNRLQSRMIPVLG